MSQVIFSNRDQDTFNFFNTSKRHLHELVAVGKLRGELD